MGNLLLKDEGVGVHVIQALQDMPLEGHGETVIIDGGTCPDFLDLLPEGAERLIIVDAVKGGGEPGSVYRFTPKDITFRRGIVTSVHQLGVAESLSMMEYLGVGPPSIVIIGVEPKQIDWGLEMSPELQERIPQITDLIKEEIDNGEACTPESRVTGWRREGPARALRGASQAR